MESNQQHQSGEHPVTVSRRAVLAGAVAVAAAQSISLVAPALAEDDDDPAETGEILAYVGTYTPNGQGIHLFRVDRSSGRLIPLKVFPSTTNPSWLAFDPSHTHLYACNEIGTFNGTSTGSVSAYAVDKPTGDLTLLNTVSSQGSGPAHLSVHPAGKFVLVANYGGGDVAVLPVLADGSLGNATDVKNDTDSCGAIACAVGPTRAVKAPPGSFAISGHDAPHAHMIQSDPSGAFVIVNDLGLDRTLIWKFDAVTGKLSDPRTVASSAGAGPRHFAFHPNGRYFYSLNEEASTLAFMTYASATGALSPVQELSTLPAEFVGTNFTSEVRVSANGRFVYAANRLHNTVAVFAVGSTGELKLLGEEWTGSDYPRSFTIDPSGRFLYACNQRSDHITMLRVEDNGRRLEFSGHYTAVGSPAVIAFLRLAV